VWLLLSAVAVAVPSLAGPWLWLGGAGGIVVLIDAVIARFTKPLDLQRRLPGRFASGEAGEVRLVLRNESGRSAKVEVFDGIPQGAAALTLPWCGEVPPNREIKVFHPVTLWERGEAVFGPVHVRRLSPL